LKAVDLPISFVFIGVGPKPFLGIDLLYQTISNTRPKRKSFQFLEVKDFSSIDSLLVAALSEVRSQKKKKIFTQ
jgi:hypothetical protein